MMVHMDVSWLRVLLDNISSYLSLSSMEGLLHSNPAYEYYTRGEDISKLLMPVLDNLIDSDAAPSELLNNGFEELSQYVDELRDQFQSWQPLSTRIFYVLRIESLASKLRESSLEVFQLLKHCEQHLPADLLSPSFEECIELVKLVAREEISYTIDQALKDQKKGVGPTLEVMLKIAKCVGLRSNQEILIEGVVLSNIKETAEITDNDTEAEYLDGLISLTTRMHDYLTDIKHAQLRCPVRVPSDFRCSLSLELMTDPVIVASGQTYERVYIQKWIDMGLMVCPKTKQALSHTTLTPNVIVRAFIASWCETHNIYPPDPLELIQSSQPFPLLVESGSGDDSSGTELDDSHKSEKAASLDDEELHQIFSRSASAPGIVSDVFSKTKRRTYAADRSGALTRSNIPWKFPEERHWRQPGIISATIRETGSSSCIDPEVKKLIEDLTSSSLDTQREATAQIRILSRNSTDNRIVIARCGAIPSLVSLLHSTDEGIQTDAVTCLLNLSINNNNKSLIADSGAIEPLIHVLKTGYLEEAKSNSATTLFSLSVIEEYKTEIGKAGAIEPLVDLLANGSLSGKKDAATALFNLSIHHENKTKVIEAGAVRYLVELMDPAFGMVEKAVVVLSNLATVREGKIAIGEEGGIPVLVDVVELGSARGKENATAALLQLCTHSPKFCNTVIREGVIPPLVALTKSGTARGKEKAQNLLKYFRAQKANQRRD
ncbi:PREDICTED: U-box domain-containing protein 2-like isoform X1 [Camelina sativa]|uniref:RING-type E3 ubiquitin transferase n=2 Tax=Camelina sativa TaxID=90675 RepID=A0ABM0UQR1_CAMSA|nr:PREDICTED: U-box domain-containing protein 2-like isoform X1 [Camelina sativa]XP_010444663.1 PREDICTED: U-box domain-containing protein 2-like isoform X1 [Camelina sativa]